MFGEAGDGPGAEKKEGRCRQSCELGRCTHDAAYGNAPRSEFARCPVDRLGYLRFELPAGESIDEI